MKSDAIIIPALGMLLMCTALAQHAELPAVPTPEALAAREDLASARTAMKRVLLRQNMRLKDDKRRLTPENAADSAKLAEELHAPEEFVQLMQMLALPGLPARSAYDCRERLSAVLVAYGVDALSIRIFVEDMPYTSEQMLPVIDSLPMEEIFNLTTRPESSPDELDAQLNMLISVYSEMASVYDRVVNKQSADAAAPELTNLVALYNKTLALRHMLNEVDLRQYKKYSKNLIEVIDMLKEQRQRLQEAAFFGSVHLQILDYFLVS